MRKYFTQHLIINCIFQFVFPFDPQNFQWYGWTDPEGRPIPIMGSYRINGNLAVARSIGDKDMKPFVWNQPEIRVFKREEALVK